MRRREPIYVITRNVLVLYLRLFFRWRFIGREKLPRVGPAIIAANHISYFDPLCQAFMVDRAERRPRFFAKAELWKNPILRFVLKGAGQIPVERGSGERGPVEQAIEALGRGEVVVIYPESTISEHDDLTPMKGKTGIARVALATGAPVFPSGAWGAQWIAPKGRVRVRTWRRHMVVQFGDPLVFPGRAADVDDAGARREVTDQIMHALDVVVREVQRVHPDGAAVPPRKPPRAAR